MMFKNSAKLLAANFANVWKILVYVLICTGLVVALIVPVGGSISTASSNVGLSQDLAEFFSDGAFFTNSPIASCKSFYYIALSIMNFVANLFVINTFACVYLLIMVFVVYPILVSLCFVPVGECVFGYMASQTKISFIGTYIKRFGRSILYSLLHFVISLPFVVLGLVGAFYSFKIATFSGAISVLSPITLVFVLTIIIALKNTILSGWVPALVVYDKCVAKSLISGFKAVGRRFFKTLSSAFVITFIYVCLIIVLYGITLPILLPMILAHLIVFNFVMYFGSQGMRYYVDQDTILKPKKLEEVDSFKKLKDLI